MAQHVARVPIRFAEKNPFQLWRVGNGKTHSNVVESVIEPRKAEEVNLTNSQLEGFRILLVEDGLDNQRLFSRILNKASAEVSVADDGQIAIDLINKAISEQRPYDVILMDMQMPVLDGYQATRQLRTDGYCGPIIALTAHAMAPDRQKCLEAGCDDYITKPIDHKRLISMISEYASRQAFHAADEVSSA